MHLVSTAALSNAAPLARASVFRSAHRHRRACVIVRADDEDMLPLLRLPRKDFTDKERAQLAKPELLGGKTIGEELTLLRQQYLDAEARASQGESRLQSDNWDGDVYIGSRWNELSILYLIFMLTPLLGLLFAWASYGVYWGVTPGLYGAPF